MDTLQSKLAHSARSQSPCASLRFFSPPLTHSASRVFSPLKHFFDGDLCFPRAKQFKARVARSIKARFCGQPSSLKISPLRAMRNARGRCFGCLPLIFFTFLFFWLRPYPLLMTAARTAAVFLIVKSGRSWPISPGGRSLSSSLNTQQVPILKTWEGNDGGLGWEAKVLNFMRPLSPSYCFKMKTKKSSGDTVLKEMQEERLKR